MKFLLLEDSPLDAEVVLATLIDGGIDCQLWQVDTREEFVTALKTDRFDLILADYALPGFDGVTALKIARAMCPNVPFIFVSGSLGEELAIESIKQGATDYVLKQRLERLIPCVHRALREAQLERDRQEVERALRQSEARFRSFAENSNDVIWITDAREYRLIYVSPSYERVWSRSSDEIYADLNNFLNSVHPEDRDRVRTSWQQCAKKIIIQEYRIISPDGETIWIRDRGFPIHDREGNLLWIGGIAEDITKQKQTAAVLAADLEATQLLHDLSIKFIREDNIEVLYDEIMAAAIISTRADAGTIQLFDAQSQDLLLLAGCGFERTMTEYFYRVDASSNTSCGTALAKGKRVFVNFDVTESEDPDGSLQKHVEAGYLYGQSTPLISRSGKPIGMVSTYWCQHYQPTERQLSFLDLVARQAADSIERKLAQAERQQLLERERAARELAERANRIKDEFLAIVSHELRSPLNPIVGWTSLLQAGKLDRDRTTQALNIIARNAKLQAELIDDLLDVSRILRGKLSLNITTVDLAQTVGSAIETVRLAAQSKSIQIQTMLEPNVGIVSGDSSRLQQVFWNLLSNAIKFTPPKGRVEVLLETFGSTAQVTVSDTGKGIKPSFLPHVFDYFRQQNSATTRQHGGLGLGLAIVYHIVQLHGGTIKADSLGEGQGATFTVKLPLVNRLPEQKSENTPSEHTFNLDKVKILVVEDDSDTREFLIFILEQYGARAIAVDSAYDALDTLTSTQPDVLLSDIGMPEVDGYMLLRKIRALSPERGGNIPAIALTAFAGEIDYQQAMSAGFQRHLAKPVEPAKLIKTIASLTVNNKQ